MKRLIAMLALVGILLVPNSARSEDVPTARQMENAQLACLILEEWAVFIMTPYGCLTKVIPTFITQMYVLYGRTVPLCGRYQAFSLQEILWVADIVVKNNITFDGGLRMYEVGEIILRRKHHVGDITHGAPEYPIDPCRDA